MLTNFDQRSVYVQLDVNEFTMKNLKRIGDFFAYADDAKLSVDSCYDPVKKRTTQQGIVAFSIVLPEELKNWESELAILSAKWEKTISETLDSNVRKTIDNQLSSYHHCKKMIDCIKKIDRRIAAIPETHSARQAALSKNRADQLLRLQKEWTNYNARALLDAKSREAMHHLQHLADQLTVVQHFISQYDRLKQMLGTSVYKEYGMLFILLSLNHIKLWAPIIYSCNVVAQLNRKSQAVDTLQFNVSECEMVFSHPCFSTPTDPVGEVRSDDWEGIFDYCERIAVSRIETHQLYLDKLSQELVRLKQMWAHSLKDVSLLLALADISMEGGKDESSDY